MANEIDIHNFPAKLEQLRTFVARGAVRGKARAKIPISKRTGELILEFERTRAPEFRPSVTSKLGFKAQGAVFGIAG
jgi:hypothetical protein